MTSLGIEKFLLYLLIALVIIACIVTFIILFFTEIECTQYKEIVAIGGCDRNGQCKVQYLDGSTVLKMYPIIGEKVCISSRTKWKEK